MTSPRLYALACAFCFALGAPLSASTTNVRLNSVGFKPALQKRATVLGAAGANAFDVRRVSDNSSAFSGTLGSAFSNADTAETVRVADFSGLTEVNSFYLDVSGVGTSAPFKVGLDVFNAPLTTVMAGFYDQRCGMAVSHTYLGDTFAHAACHTGDGDLNYYSGSGTKDGTGGWHDAGDFGKYTVNAGVTLGCLLQAWERYSSVLQYMQGQAPVAGLPDYLAEVKWELDWLLKMQFPGGRVSHKLTGTNFEGFIMPESDSNTRYFVPFSTDATGQFAAATALASRLYQPYNPAYATTLLNAAWAAYGSLTTTGYTGAAQGAFSTGGYDSGAGNDNNTRIWAAAELWETTGDPAVLAYLESRISAKGPNKIDWGFDWGNVANLGMFTYAQSARAGKNAVLEADVKADIKTAADAQAANAGSHGYGFAPNYYTWGINGIAARQCLTLDVANRLYPSVAYLNAAQSQLGFLFGRNYYCRSFVTGIGVSPPMNPHDRQSASDGVTAPRPGHLVGGSHRYTGTLPTGVDATHWTDDQNRYETNEIAINWDGALVYALAMQAAAFPPPPTPTVTPTPTATLTPCPLCTPTPTATSTPVQGLVPRVYPNPVNLNDTDAVSRVTHFDQVEPGTAVQVYNVIGDKVWEFSLTGNPSRDYWDGVNANGATVATGVYLFLFKQPSGKQTMLRVAVIRE
jgi:endoglucanase